ncbi:alpha/beta hydrolase [Pseudomonas sp. HK3]
MNTQTYLPCIEIKPKSGPANAAIIWLHGLGATGDDFAPMAKHLNFDKRIAMHYVFPHAPQRSVAINGGASMPAWYDLQIEGVERKANLNDLAESREQVLAKIDELIATGIPSERIIIAGFSQGGAVAYDVLFNGAHSLAGVMPMSTYIADANVMNNAKFKQTPIWLSHGTLDDVVPMSLGERALNQLKQAGFEPTMNDYQMAHNVCPSQVKDIQKFIETVLA